MMFIQVKSLAGVNFVRAGDVVAVSFTDATRCNVIMPGGISLPCTEAASVVAARIEEAVADMAATPAAQSEIQKG